ncbi:sugar phosphate isomerase [Candidatus Aerophobetes bacterium Ae_b3a]|nr:MAG: sugar phosphate isomerase [Candidatus Aerophobetes bacterium Ae_b3a]
MKIGFLADYSEEILGFACEAGFKSLQLRARPDERLDAYKMLAGGIEEVKSTISKYDIEISSLLSAPNHLDPDSTQRKKNNNYFMKLIDVCSLLNVKVVGTFAGRDPEKSIEDNIPLFKEVFTVYVEHAKEKGVKIAIENCPMMRGHYGFPFRGVNMGYTPKAWDLIFNAVDSPYLGLEFDPSHLYWLQIDYVQAIYGYGEKVYHVHAKDAEILHNKLAKEGVYGKGWWRYRIPGMGSINWQRVITALLDVGYQGSIDIEHEDPVLEGKRHKEGLLIGLKHLSRFIL